MKFLTHRDVFIRAKGLVRQIKGRHGTEDGAGLAVHPIPRGGVPVAYYLLSYLPELTITSSPEQADFFIDDLVDSGHTEKEYTFLYGRPFYALVWKGSVEEQFVDNEPIQSGEWVSFPWEQAELGGMDDVPRRLLQYIGEDPSREGLLDTPRRFIEAWDEWTGGYRQNPSDILCAFDDGGEEYDEMVFQEGITFWSTCEHHLAPIWGIAHIGYIPNGKIVGLSKLCRLVEMFARRLQVQERMTVQIADALYDNLQPKGVGVVVRARHGCMESRGVQQRGTVTTTSALRGVMYEEHSARNEFLAFVRGATTEVV